MARHSLIFAVIALTIISSCSSSSGTAKRADALDESLWEQSSWISAANAPVITGTIKGANERAADGSSWFLSTIRNDKKVTSAKWMTAGLGVYELYVNGSKVGDEILKPGFTHYAKTKRSFTYDITGLLNLKSGAENILAAQVTPGWWGDKIITPGGHEGMIGKKTAFRSILELSYSDGTKQVYGTDTDNWTAGIAGPVTHAAIFDGEEYDARILPGYATPEKLSTPEINNEFNGEILPSDGAEVYLRPDLTLYPVQAYTWNGVTGKDDSNYGKIIITREFASGEEIVVPVGETLVVDFGQNCAAVPSFEFKATEGTTLTCLPSELLNDGNGSLDRGMDGPEGSVHRLNLRIPDQGIRLVYTFAGKPGYESFCPTCTFFGYRYVSITATAEVKIKSIKSIPVSSITNELETGTIVTGNELVNKLISNTLWGQRSNYLSVPTDCPQRNERLGWTADTQVFTETGTYFANTDRFFHKWTRDLRDTQGEFGGFPGVAPLAQYGAEPTSMMRVGWSDAGIIVPWTVWKQFADVEIVKENWDAMVKFIDHMASTKYSHELLTAENGNSQWADWLSYEPLETCGGGAFTGERHKSSPLPDAISYWNFLCASYWLIDAQMMLDMSKAIGEDSAKYEQMVTEARAYITSEFFSPDGKFKTAILNTMQTPALFALKNKVVEGKAKDDMIARLRKNFEDHGNCLQTGFLGTSILMNTLTENGMSDIAYELLFQRKNPSWLYSIDNGATTIWERWNSYMIESGMGPKGMNSFNHYAYGCVCEWIWKTVCGIAADVDNPGFKHIIMKPVPDRRLGHVDATYDSAAGTIRSSWKYEGNNWIWDFTIPEGASATVLLPGETESKDYSAGSYTLSISLERR